MNLTACVKELRDNWFPHTTDMGLKRLMTLLEEGSPYLIHGTFTKSLPMGCMATHIAWHHPTTRGLTHDAGIIWLSHIAGLNPATSLVIRAWDEGGQANWPLRNAILNACREESTAREQRNAIWADELQLA
jgi:hypothetical protein